ncbi:MULTISPECIES: LysR substrate-binding domain-containing protein [unclassified Pseudonocardia]|uniref:LysR substrate-binding domain-containing protein n=1 Tax=unclassified Pseudonocardia TaxID=2619320 RepID=UPI00094B5D5A|nr:MULTISPECIES: LysR substrate-binding domain-containing protein [unclassified Pseudonocardia]OLL71782.1 Chromosome initiation inhibitor [Pseudonocardia sp. Ae150A_Ps1]OLL88127.1 Chromosome initiation inhibitor [Pseudonocardia sp. Ae263_Ps1]OLL91847.1 Chromosome initiation inhibitor [Pseudonocardia sp. Ae356_Ps1]
MDLRQLRYFVAVAETRHFGRAAERLHMAQSPLSQAIRQLESQVGATLFERTTRRVDLTPAGESLLSDAYRILASVDDARRRVERVAAGADAVVTVGATDLAAYRLLPRLARVVSRRMPAVTLRFRAGLLTSAQEDALDERRIDIGVLRPPVVRTELSTRTVARERLVAALPAGHRLAARTSVSLTELRGDDFVAYGAPGSVVDSVAVQGCLGAGFLPRRHAEARDTPILLTHVAAGEGVALLPESVRALGTEGVTYTDLEEELRVDLALAWRTEDRSPALVRLLDVLADHARELDPATAPTPLLGGLP